MLPSENVFSEAFVLCFLRYCKPTQGLFVDTRLIYSCVRNLSGVVAGEAFVEILCHACVMVLPGGCAAEDVDVVEAGGGHRRSLFIRSTSVAYSLCCICAAYVYVS